MPIVSKRERRQYLEDNFPVLFKLCFANSPPEILSYRLNTELPFSYRNSDESSAVPADWDSEVVSVIPLWEGGSSLTAIRVTALRREFIQIDFEDPGDAEVIAVSTEGLFTYLFFFLIESLGEKDDDELREIEDLAAYLEFQGLPATFSLVERLSADEDYERLFAATRSL
jgi:hypothetical protein